VLIVVLILGILTALILLAVGVSTKKALVAGMGLVVGILVIGFLALLALVNSPYWQM
jgi:hypothetical protein